jgi:hypothetical protein
MDRHKPITFAFKHNSESCSPRQFRYLDFISQFTTDIQHISGSSNIVADALFRIEGEAFMKQPLNYKEIAANQVLDEELQTLISKGTALQLQYVPIPESDQKLLCDMSTGAA